jgi:hypothetical protein
VPYRGMAPIVTDLIGGHMPLEHIPLTHTHTPHVQRNFHIVGD